MSSTRAPRLKQRSPSSLSAAQSLLEAKDREIERLKAKLAAIEALIPADIDCWTRTPPNPEHTTRVIARMTVPVVWVEFDSRLSAGCRAMERQGSWVVERYSSYQPDPKTAFYYT